MKNKLEQTAYWDQVAENKIFSHAIDWDFLSPHLKPDSQILDYGCGYGRLTKTIFERGYTSVIGVDNSSGMIDRARRELPNLNFTHHNEATLDFANDQFDVVLLFAVLTCIPSNDDQAVLIQELKRVLKPNGLFYISDLLINTDQRNTDRYNATQYEPYGVFELPEGAILRHHDLSYLEEEVFKDLDILYQRVYDVTTMNGNTSKSVQLVGRKRSSL